MTYPPGKRNRMQRSRAYPPPRPRVGEELFRFCDLAFNITYALESVIGVRRARHLVKASSLLDGARIREAHMSSERVKRRDPVIIATLPAPFFHVCIDGHHRAEYAHREGREWLPAWVLDEEETRACCFTRAALLRLKREADHERGKAYIARALGAAVPVFRR